MKMTRTIFGVKSPSKDCSDGKCPFHGNISVKEELIKGRIVKKDVHHSATIEWARSYHVPKYERFEMRRSRIRVHNPECLNAGIGDDVLVARTKPLSKSKNHVVIKIIASGDPEVEKSKKIPKKKISKESEENSIEKQNESD